MKTFKDSAGRQWTLSVTVAAVKRVRDLAKVDLLTPDMGGLLKELADDPVKLADVLWALVQPQAGAQETPVTDEQFGEALAGQAIDDATEAFLSELVDFFPQPRRGLLAKALKKMQKLSGMATDAASKALDGETLEKVMQEQLDEAEAELEADMRTELRKKTPGEPSGSSPAPPA